jgi:hypothetical protein
MAKIGGSDVPVGPNIVLEGLLNACDRDVDRKCADAISKELREEDLAELDPMSTMTNLPVLCLALMQNFPPSDQALLGAELNKIRTDRALLPDAQVRAVIIQLSKFLSAELVLGVIRDSKPLLSVPFAAPLVAEGPRPASELGAEVRAVLAEALLQIVQEGGGSPPGEGTPTVDLPPEEPDPHKV